MLNELDALRIFDKTIIKRQMAILETRRRKQSSLGFKRCKWRVRDIEISVRAPLIPHVG